MHIVKLTSNDTKSIAKFDHSHKSKCKYLQVPAGNWLLIHCLPKPT